MRRGGLAGIVGGVAARVLATGLLLTAIAVGPGAHADGESTAPTGPAGVPLPAQGRPWFGPELDWDQDTAASYATRTGSDLSLFGRTYAYPLTDGGAHELLDQADQAHLAGAAAVVTLEPSVGLARLSPEDARDAAQVLGEATGQGTAVLVRFAPSMNTPDVAWGQHPPAYDRAFRQLANQVHAAAPGAAMVWSPSAVGRSDRDPYGPYFPGEAYVDWVGLDVSDDGAGTFDHQLGARVPDGTDGGTASFYTRFAGQAATPLLIATGSDDQAWIDAALHAGRGRKQLAGVLWTAPEVSLGPALDGAPLSLGPVPAPTPAPADAGSDPTNGSSGASASPSEPSTSPGAATRPESAPAAATSGGGVGPFLLGVLVTLLVVLVVAVVALQVRRRRAVPTWLR